MTRLLILFVTAMFLPAAVAAEGRMTKETFVSGGETRTYYLLVPDAARKSRPAPLLVLLHGAGRDGKSLMDKWEPLARKEGIVLAGPDARVPGGWRVPDDGPDFLRDLVELLRQQLDIDAQRVYLFGHSAGAGHALAMAVLESEYFAAAGVHAGAMHESMFPLIDAAPRKIPIGIWVGTRDASFPLPVVRATRDALQAQGYAPELTEIRGHTHWYYDRAPGINRQVWTFLRQHALPNPPRYQRHPWSR